MKPTAWRARKPQAADRHGEGATWAWSALLLWASSPLEAWLSGVDPAAPLADTSHAGLYRLAHDAVLAPALLVFAARPAEMLALSRVAWPLLLWLGYAALSTVWSIDADASSKALVNGAPLLALGAALPLALGPRRAVQALLQALALAALGGVLAAALLPRFAVTQAGDVLGAGAAGAWRGLYVHKNMLGHACALAAAGLLSPAARRLAPPLRLAGGLSALLCLLMSHSASGLAIALLLPVVAALRRPKGALRLTLLGAGVAAAALLAALRGPLTAGALSAFGRDDRLSGRTDIWRAAGDLSAGRPLRGWGLDVTASPAMGARLQGLFGVDHLHNAALDILLNLGAIGAGLWALAIGWALFGRAGREADGPERETLALLLFGWLMSGLTEDMGVRTAGPVALVGVTSLWSLYALQAGAAHPHARPVFDARRLRLGSLG